MEVMKKLFKTQTGVYVLGIIALVILVAMFVFCSYKYHSGMESLSTQQQWSSGKEDFDRAYQISISDKEKPEKTIYAPNLVSCLGKSVEECVSSIGQGAKVTAAVPVAEGTQTTIELTNESSNVKSVTPKVILISNSSGSVISASFTASTWALGFPKLSFTDMINNENICEKTLNESGLNIELGTIKAPENRSSYTTYASDGTTVVTENWSCSGKNTVNNKSYNWSANLVYDYSYANVSGNLAETIRSITISVYK